MVYSFDTALREEAEKYLQSVNDKLGTATTNRQIGQRRRRLREALYEYSSQSSGNKQFTDNEASFKDAAINALIEEVNIQDSMGADIEKYGSPPGGMLRDEEDYLEDTDDEEIIEGYVIKPKTAEIFGDEDGFADWMVNVYLQKRPQLKKMIEYNYWKTKGGKPIKGGGKTKPQLKFGKKRSPEGLAKALEWVSWRLRTHISEKGIKPNSVVISDYNTILNYDSGSHELNRGRMN